MTSTVHYTNAKSIQLAKFVRIYINISSLLISLSFSSYASKYSIVSH
jgi:hypothetical protein